MGQSDVHEYVSDFGLRRKRLMQAHGLETEAPIIEPGAAAKSWR